MSVKKKAALSERAGCAEASEAHTANSSLIHSSVPGGLLRSKSQQLAETLQSAARVWQNFPPEGQPLSSKQAITVLDYSLMQAEYLRRLAEEASSGNLSQHSGQPEYLRISAEAKTALTAKEPSGQLKLIPEQKAPELSSVALTHQLYVNYAIISNQDRKILRKFRRQFGEEPSVSFLLSLCSQDLLANPGWGRTSVAWLKDFQQRLTDLLKRFDSTSLYFPETTPPALISHQPVILPAHYIDWALDYDFAYLLENMTEEVRAIAAGRWAYCCQHQSLEEIGLHFGKTRERIRQLEVAFNHIVPLSMRIAPQVLQLSLQQHPRKDLACLLPKLASRFSRKRNFYEFIDLCTGSSASESWLQKQWTDTSLLSFTELEHYFAISDHHMDQQTLITAIESIFTLTTVQAMQVFSFFLDSGKLIPTEGGSFRPGTMRKNNAVAWALLEHPQGLHWTKVYEKLRALKLLRAESQEDRLDASFTENDKIFLIEQGTYCHKRFLGLSPEMEASLIREVKSCLAHKHRNKSSLQAVWAELRQQIPVDYFKLRYVVSGPGLASGLSFDGASRNDMVSLQTRGRSQTASARSVLLTEAEGPA
ncbi:MAG: hypothetical protein H6618_01405 [Deltaproteobacteria bacterium]|nr:hypothetical protein [Deltaproteobacteria bacterium]